MLTFYVTSATYDAPTPPPRRRLLMSRQWLPTLGLDTSEKEKHAIYVEDLYAILHALWIDDRQPLHGLVRIIIALLLVVSAATGTRPSALIALTFKDVEIMKVRSLENSNQSTILVNVNLVKVKNQGTSGTPYVDRLW
jgi:integrase